MSAYVESLIQRQLERRLPHPVAVLTSDPEDLLMPCGPSVRVIKV
ncbi:hypothetical protein ACGFWD_29720 [Streptomyces sp. NPDC048448]|uniref:Uncharacterized protein n=1 Tax=Streptomyces kaempferi TaxID=333725 RepID=A0ABW3XI36_9ACTN|nr:MULTISPECIES: hypothetical protein [unclassified Streptomyces]